MIYEIMTGDAFDFSRSGSASSMDTAMEEFSRNNQLRA